mmetsp:Transcript_9267/g.18516  ORF Transcript_9267/g.18516 Transcript_9267/m.18516 type:complete len:176 (-) Transcript_9267:547-1074(-)
MLDVFSESWFQLCSRRHAQHDFWWPEDPRQRREHHVEELIHGVLEKSRVEDRTDDDSVRRTVVSALLQQTCATPAMLPDFHSKRATNSWAAGIFVEANVLKKLMLMIPRTRLMHVCTRKTERGTAEASLLAPGPANDHIGAPGEPLRLRHRGITMRQDCMPKAPDPTDALHSSSS